MMRLRCVGMICLLLGCSGPDDCGRICARALECGAIDDSGEAATCARVCRASVASYGDVGATVAHACASCVDGATCEDLWAGACDPQCPTGTGLGPTPPPPADSGTAPADGGTAGECRERWALDGGGDREVVCQATGSDLTCRCYESGLETDVFWSSDFCARTPAQRADLAARGCGW